MKKPSSGSNLDANLEMTANLELLLLVYSFKLYICQDPRIGRAYTAQNTKIKRTSRLPRSACIRVHVEVRNGYGRARGVGAAPRRRALERSSLTEDSSSENCILRPRRKKLRTESPQRQNNHIYIYLCMLYRHVFYPSQTGNRKNIIMTRSYVHGASMVCHGSAMKHPSRDMVRPWRIHEASMA